MITKTPYLDICKSKIKVVGKSTLEQAIDRYDKLKAKKESGADREETFALILANRDLIWGCLGTLRDLNKIGSTQYNKALSENAKLADEALGIIYPIRKSK